ncbi:MAG: hypothetical protein WC164_00775 [Patescibacteria group bacterium]
MLFDSEAEINKRIKKIEKDFKSQNKITEVFYDFIDNNSIIANELFLYYYSKKKKPKKSDYTGCYVPMLSFLN